MLKLVCIQFCVESNLCMFLSYVYMCINVRDPVIKEGRHGIPLTNSTPSLFCTGLKRGSEFPPSYAVLFYAPF